MIFSNRRMSCATSLFARSERIHQLLHTITPEMKLRLTGKYLGERSKFFHGPL